MGKDNKSKPSKSITLNWDDFKNMGNPDNASEEVIDDIDDTYSTRIHKSEKIRVILDRKNRRGKSVSLILGLEEYEDEVLKPISKELKSLCGVGGNLKKGEIMLQGDHRDKIIKFFQDQGFTNVKKSGG